MIFQGILTSIAKTPYIFAIFFLGGGGGLDPLPPPLPLDPPMQGFEIQVMRLLLCIKIALITPRNDTLCYAGYQQIQQVKIYRMCINKYIVTDRIVNICILKLHTL